MTIPNIEENSQKPLLLYANDFKHPQRAFPSTKNAALDFRLEKLWISGLRTMVLTRNEQFDSALERQ